MLDSFDRRILAEIQRKGDLGPSELSERINLSASQCSRRLQRLKAEGYVDQTVALLNRARLNLSVTAYVLITLRSHEADYIQAFKALVQANPQIVECASTTGEADFVLRVCTRDLESYNLFLTRTLLPAKEIATARTSIVLDQLKDTTELSLEFLS